LKPGPLLAVAICLAAACQAAAPRPEAVWHSGSVEVAAEPASTPAPASEAPPSLTHPAPSASPQRPTATLTPGRTATRTHTPAAATRLLFTGDINPGRCPAQVALRHNDFTLPFAIVGEVLRSAGITIGSLDGTLSDQSPPSPCPETLNLIGPRRMVEGLAYAGFDVITTATNHAKDCGHFGWNCFDRAMFDTLETLAGAGILAVGSGDSLAAARAPAVVERHGLRFAFLGVTEVGPETWARDGPDGSSRAGTAPLSDEALPGLLARIAAAREIADVVVVLPQWGVEYAEMPSDNQWRWAGEMIAAGATLVIGNHAHVVQPVEVFESGGRQAVVAYALGNFVFDQGPWRTRQGVVFEAVFDGPELASWQLLPIHIRSLHQPHWADEAEAAAILTRIDEASARLPQR
jgi:poly-gamma-glutamate capsule biosynthesis protein CapA/YwtB (metallophosphatase superfamily)